MPLNKIPSTEPVASPRCAKTRSGAPCKTPPVTGKKRCRMHGGAAGSGAPIGNQNALKHGRYTADRMAIRRHLFRALRQIDRGGDPSLSLVLTEKQRRRKKTVSNNK